MPLLPRPVPGRVGRHSPQVLLYRWKLLVTTRISPSRNLCASSVLLCTVMRMALNEPALALSGEAFSQQGLFMSQLVAHGHLSIGTHPTVTLGGWTEGLGAPTLQAGGVRGVGPGAPRCPLRCPLRWSAITVHSPSAGGAEKAGTQRPLQARARRLLCWGSRVPPPGCLSVTLHPHPR